MPPRVNKSMGNQGSSSSSIRLDSPPSAGTRGGGRVFTQRVGQVVTRGRTIADLAEAAQFLADRNNDRAGPAAASAMAGEKRKRPLYHRDLFYHALRLFKAPPALQFKAVEIDVTHDETLMAEKFANVQRPLPMIRTCFPPGELKLSATDTWVQIELQLVAYGTGNQKFELEELYAYHTHSRPEHATLAFSLPDGYNTPYFYGDSIDYKFEISQKEPSCKKGRKKIVRIPAFTMNHSNLVFVRYTIWVRESVSQLGRAV